MMYMWASYEKKNWKNVLNWRQCRRTHPGVKFQETITNALATFFFYDIRYFTGAKFFICTASQVCSMDKISSCRTAYRCDVCCP